MTEERLTTNIVSPDGPPDAAICFIGEAPGEEEDRHPCLPFKGAAGGLLNRCFRTTGIIRSEVLLNNIFVQRPPKNNVNYYFTDNSNRKPTWEGEEHIARLAQWLKKLQESPSGGPKVLGALGATALYILTGKKRITKWRGSVLPCTLAEGYKVYSLFHPSYVSRMMNEPEERLVGTKKAQVQNALPLFLKDLERIQEQAKARDFQRPKRLFEISLELPEILDRLQELPQHSTVAVDIETLPSGQGPLLWCIGFSPSPDRAFVIPFLRNFKHVWDIQREAKLLREISKVFLNPKITKVFHNGLYDLSILGRYYGLQVDPESLADTMYCYHACYPYLSKALSTLTSIYTWEPYYKDDGKIHFGKRSDDNAEFIYNARDCCVTREIWPIVARDAKEKHFWKGYQKTMKRISSLLYMHIRGVAVDVKQKEELGVKFKVLWKEAESIVVAETSQEWNLNSPSQISRLLYGFCRMPVQYNHKTKKVTTDKDAVNRLRKKFPKNPILKAISDYRTYSKLDQTYTTMEVSNDARIRTSYGFVSTYRLSSSESFFGGGGNLQNIPVRTEEGKLVRKLFISDPGYIFLASDLAQAEARDVAYESNDVRLIELFEAGVDTHWEEAKRIFRFPPNLPYEAKELYQDSFTEEEHPMKFYRDRAKSIVHATNYMMGPRMLQTILIREEVFFPEALCKQLLFNRRQDNPLLVLWQNKVIDQVKATRTLISSYGRKREFRGRLSSALFRSAVAFSPQNTVGELLQDAIEEIYEKLEIFEILMNVHDEVVGQCLPKDLQKSMQQIKLMMERPIEINGRTLTIPCDFKSGPSWGELEEVKLPKES